MTAKKVDDMWTVLRMLEWATGFFEDRNIPDPRHSIEWLLAYVLDCKRLDLYLQFERPLSTEELNRIRPIVKRRAAHEPLQYITGSANFMGCEIAVSPAVLIPRIETEQLVELILDECGERSDSPLNLLDVGTGSGCIPLAIKKNAPAWNCFGIDISADSLDLARRNAEANGLDVNFSEEDLFQLDKMEVPEGGWDIVVSNPPYIRNSEKPSIQKQVIEYEPEGALFHENPLVVYRSIIHFASQKNSALFLELNDRLSEQIFDIAAACYPQAKLHQDLDNNPRFLSANSGS